MVVKRTKIMICKAILILMAKDHLLCEISKIWPYTQEILMRLAVFLISGFKSHKWLTKVLPLYLS